MNTLNSLKARRVLVTGASGFVGRYLCAVLSAAGWQVVAAVRNPNTADLPSSVERVALELFAKPEKWHSTLSDCRAVVHLAAHVHQMALAPHLESQFFRVNVDGSAFVAEHAVDAGVDRFVFMSSVKVNGEGAPRCYNVDDPVNPQDAYGRSKWAAEERLTALCKNSTTGLVVIRPPLVYGPGVGANFRRLMQLIYWGVPLPLGSIENRRSLIGIGNLADFVSTCLEHPLAARTWLVSDGEDLSTPDLLRRLSHVMGRSSKVFRFSQSRLRWIAVHIGARREFERLCESLYVDSASSRSILSWRPPHSVDKELARTAERFLSEVSGGA